VEGAKAAVPFVVVTLTLSACGNRLPLSDRELTDVIRNAQEFSATTDCSEGVKGRRELLSVADASMVTCESLIIDECRCFARLRWRWRTESTNVACPVGATESYGELLRTSRKPWRLTTFQPLPFGAKAHRYTDMTRAGIGCRQKGVHRPTRHARVCATSYSSGGRRRCQSVCAWKSRPMASRVFSVNGRPTS
jgi:hypothetical protein